MGWTLRAGCTATLALTLTACGGSDGGTTGTSLPAATVTVQDTVTAAPSPSTVTVTPRSQASAAARPSASSAPTRYPSASVSKAPSASLTPSEEQTASTLPEQTQKTIQALPKGEQAAPGEQLSSSNGTNSSGYTMHDFLTYVMTDVDKYWSGVWSQAGYQEPYVNYVLPGPGESTWDKCSGQMEGSDAAHYCFVDDRIVIGQEMARKIWEGSLKVNEDPDTGQAAGDFSVAYVVAHEYAHSLQSELGIVPNAQDRKRRYPTYKTELHADCWAGVWANSAYAKGLLEAGDVEEGIKTAQDIGEYDFTDAQHHGTPLQRADAFLDGYNIGVPSACDPFLTEDYQ